MQGVNNDEIRRVVRQHYARVAKQGDSCCAPGDAGACCNPMASSDDANCISSHLTYSESDIKGIPEGANLGLSCGNPVSLAAVEPKDTVLDLGSGSGIDCFIAARLVGASGLVIGVDMTSEMIFRARQIAEQNNYTNVEFRLGELENLPVADESVNVIISNCVINLSPDKPRVFREAMRVLKPGGRLAISDMISLVRLPQEIRNDPALYCGCIGGALFMSDLEGMLEKADFASVTIKTKGESVQPLHAPVTRDNFRDYVVPATIQALKKQ